MMHLKTLLLAVLCLLLAGTRGLRADQASYDRAVAALRLAQEPYARWCMLGRAAKESFEQGHFDEAKVLAEELERLAPEHVKDWNYGNAVQDANIVLGRLALRENNVAVAKSRLLAAGRSPGSPQMDTFGPNMTLARDLLDRGEPAIVLDYFDLCRKFWQMGGNKLDLWKKAVEQGKKPDFGVNLVF